jgi:L-ribulose-5-phosphate 3-epimerase
MNQIGIMQGRLSPPAERRLQAFPWNSWEKEFAHARACGFDAIEWLFEAEDYEQNPLWTDAGVEKIQSLVDETGVAVLSVCADYFMAHPFFRVGDSERLRSVAVLNQLISRAAQLGIKTILVPVLEESELRNEKEKVQLLESLRAPLELAARHGIRLGLETELPAGEYNELVEQGNHPALGVYYDVGNATAKGYDSAADVRILGRHLCGIHIKDRKRNGPSVLLGQGDVNFSEFSAALAETRYAGLLVLQTAFGDDFLSNAKAHLGFVRQHIDDGMLSKTAVS